MLASSQFINYNQVSMSIPNIFHKIKSKSLIDKSTIMYLFIIVGVGIGSFGLGRLSVVNTDKDSVDNGISILSNKALLGDANIKENDSKLIEPINNVKEKRYVASKNGKMYYSPGCSGASRIKPENQIWFSTSQDAEKSGYSKSKSCN